MPSVRVIVDNSNPIVVGLVASLPQKDVFRVKKFVGDGLVSVFSMGEAFRPNSLAIYLGGILQEVSVDYVENGDGKSITFTVAPEDGEKIEGRYVKA